MKSSKLVSCRSPYCRRNSLKRGTPRSRSRMMSSAATSTLPVALGSRGTRGSAGIADGCAARACRRAGGPCDSAQFAMPRSRIARVAFGAGTVSTTGMLAPDHVRVVVPLAVLDQVGHQRVQPVHRDELLREIERRAEVIDAAVDVIGIGDAPDVGRAPHRRERIRIDVAAEPEDAGARCEHRVPRRRLARARRTCRNCARRCCRARPTTASSAIEQAAPVGVHAAVAAARRTAVAASTRSCGSSRSPRRRPAAPSRTARRRHVAIADHRVGSAGVAQPGVRVGRARGLPAERVDECVVLAREQVVEEAQADRPVVGERRRLLAGPLGSIGSPARTAAGTCPSPFASRGICVISQARRVGRIALDAPPRVGRRSRTAATRPTRR